LDHQDPLLAGLNVLQSPGHFPEGMIPRCASLDRSLVGNLSCVWRCCPEKRHVGQLDALRGGCQFLLKTRSLKGQSLDPDLLNPNPIYARNLCVGSSRRID
jgi:hypothetical protein